MARSQAEIGADTLSKTQFNELWQATKTRTNKALNAAARDGLPPPLSPTFSRTASPTAPEFSSGAVVVSAQPAAPHLPRAADGEALLAQAASLPGALQTASHRAGGRGKVRWYEVGTRPDARAQREAMYAHLVGQRPELANRTWSIPRYGKGTLRELLVERGVVPAELADRYAVAGATRRPNGGRARQEAARGASGSAPAFSEVGGATPSELPQGDESHLEGWTRKLRGLPPEVNIPREHLTFVDHAEAQKWAKDNIKGLKNVNYGSIDISVVQQFNEVVKAITDHFRVEVESIGPFGQFEFIYHGETPTMASRDRKIGFEQWNLIPGSIFDEFKRTLENSEHTSVADKTIEAVIAHEMGHILQRSGRYIEGAAMDPQYSEWCAQQIVEEYLAKHEEAQVIKELGTRAVKGSRSYPDEPWRETWALAFSAYWMDRNSIRPETREMVERVLAKLYPDVR